VAQRLARMVWDHEVGGSNPLTPTIILDSPYPAKTLTGRLTSLEPVYSSMFQHHIS